jgi:porphobilinogen synthase
MPAAFPATRLRRLRRTGALRDLVRETTLAASDLVLPIFVEEGLEGSTPIDSMPGVSRHGIGSAVQEAGSAFALGVPAVILFGIPAEKDADGSSAWDDEGAVQLAIRAIKAAHPELVVITDVCLCEYTDHGHCGVIENGEVANDATLEILANQALSHARAGADIVAPSDMMDGRVAAIRSSLDTAGRHNTPILSYASKFASAFYGPFREAADSAPQFGDRRTYQMDGANRREAMREIAQDLAEGADMILMKPAMPYLDIIRDARERFDVPLGAYQVSGEYAMLHAAFQRGWLEPERAMLESLLGIRRAGADFIVTYFAKEAAKIL